MQLTDRITASHPVAEVVDAAATMTLLPCTDAVSPGQLPLDETQPHLALPQCVSATAAHTLTLQPQGVTQAHVPSRASHIM